MKKDFIKKLSSLFFIRLHMSIILLMTFLSGMLFSKLSYSLGWTDLTSRYLVSFIVSYLSFIGSIRIWLWYIFKKAPENNTDLSDLDFLDLWIVGQNSSVQSYNGNGGSFSGGGASGSFGDNDEKGIIDSISDIGGDSDEAAPILLVIGLILFIAAIMFGGFYLIFEAPMFLGEIAFDLALTLGVIKSKTRKDHPVSWLKGITKKTIIPAIVIGILIILLGITIKYYNPSVTQSRELLEWIVTIE